MAKSKTREELEDELLEAWEEKKLLRAALEKQTREGVPISMLPTGKTVTAYALVSKGGSLFVAATGQVPESYFTSETEADTLSSSAGNLVHAVRKSLEDPMIVGRLFHVRREVTA